MNVPLRDGEVNRSQYTDGWLSAQSDLDLMRETDRLVAIYTDLERQFATKKPTGPVPNEEYRDYRLWKGNAVRFKQVVLWAMRQVKDERRRRAAHGHKAGPPVGERPVRQILADLVAILGEFDFQDERVVALLDEARPRVAGTLAWNESQEVACSG